MSATSHVVSGVGNVFSPSCCNPSPSPPLSSLIFLSHFPFNDNNQINLIFLCKKNKPPYPPHPFFFLASAAVLRFLFPIPSVLLQTFPKQSNSLPGPRLVVKKIDFFFSALPTHEETKAQTTHVDCESYPYHI